MASRYPHPGLPRRHPHVEHEVLQVEALAGHQLVQMGAQENGILVQAPVGLRLQGQGTCKCGRCEWWVAGWGGPTSWGGGRWARSSGARWQSGSELGGRSRRRALAARAARTTHPRSCPPLTRSSSRCRCRRQRPGQQPPQRSSTPSSGSPEGVRGRI